MNNKIFFLFFDLAHKSAFFDKVAVFTAQYLPYLTVLAAAIFVLFYLRIVPSRNPFKEFIQKWKEIAMFSLPVLSAWIIANILKYLVHAPRPFEALHNVIPLIAESGYAFPSDHATFFMALAVPIFVYNKKAGYVFITLAVLIGLARIVVGVHSPEDILGGFILGAGVAIILSQNLRVR